MDPGLSECCKVYYSYHMRDGEWNLANNVYKMTAGVAVSEHDFITPVNSENSSLSFLRGDHEVSVLSGHKQSVS